MGRNRTANVGKVWHFSHFENSFCSRIAPSRQMIARSFANKLEEIRLLAANESEM